MRLTMSPQSRHELLRALRPQYQKASKSEKKQLLDGLVTATGYSRKYAVTLLSKNIGEKRQGKRSRKRKYDEGVVNALILVWKSANRVCSKRLIPFMPTMIESLTRFGHLDVSETVKAQLMTISPATADRLLKKEKLKYGKGKSTTKPGHLIKKHIPVRTFADWNDVVPGFLEGDLVAHCAENIRGQFLHTLTMTDIATGWTELEAVLSKNERDVLEAIIEIKDVLPFPLLGFDTDNGGEFINYGVLDWCTKNNITFTRSREYKKNDQAHVEEKNGSLVRRYIGYDRYEGIESWQLLSQLYGTARFFINFFQPCQKLISKERDGARVRKRYDKAKTPYERLLDSPTVAEEWKTRMRKIFPTLDPVALLKKIESFQTDLWKTAIRSGIPQQSEQIDESRSQCSLLEIPSEQEHQVTPKVEDLVVRHSPPKPTRRKAKPINESRTELHTQAANDWCQKESRVENHPNDSARDTSVFAVLLESFFARYLMKRSSPHTINSYRDTFRLLHQFAQQRPGKQFSQLDITELDTVLINAFLEELETKRGSSSGSRNLRLAAIRSFCRYAAAEVPSQATQLQKILAIPSKEYARPVINFLTRTELDALLAAPDRQTWSGCRDHALLLVAVETGFLVSELIGLHRQDVHLQGEGHLRIIGKGRKERCTPLANDTVAVLNNWMKQSAKVGAQTLFPNARGGRLTSSGAHDILRKHTTTACTLCPSLEDKRVTFYLLRHSKALELVQSGHTSEQVANWLGLESEAAQTYVKANLALKKQLTKITMKGDGNHCANNGFERARDSQT